MSSSTSRPPAALRIGGASAFRGDSNAGVAQLVRDGDVQVLVFDYLAELTMSLLQRARSKDPGAGYAGDFIAAVTPLLATFGHADYADYAETLVEVLGSEKPSYGDRALAQGAREVVLRLAVRHASPAALEILAREIAPFGVSGAAGTTGFSGRAKVQPVFRLYSFLWPKQRVPATVELDGTVASVSIPVGRPAAEPVADGRRHVLVPMPQGERVTVPLSALAVARSGDKGDRSNIDVIARRPQFVAAIAEQLTAEMVASCFSHLVRGKVTRFDVPGVHAFNFLLEQALAGGGAASLRNDPLGKTVAQVLLASPMRIPAARQDDIDKGPPLAAGDSEAGL